MVTFKLIEETDEYLLYWYYAEGDESLKPGIIIVDKIKGKIDITELAENDWERDISVEELNELAESVNREIREEGERIFWNLQRNRSIAYFLETMQSMQFGINCVKELFRKKELGLGIDEALKQWFCSILNREGKFYPS